MQIAQVEGREKDISGRFIRQYPDLAVVSNDLHAKGAILRCGLIFEGGWGLLVRSHVIFINLVIARSENIFLHEENKFPDCCFWGG